MVTVRSKPASWEDEERRKKNDGKEKGMKNRNKREGEQERKDGIKKEMREKNSCSSHDCFGLEQEEGERRKKIECNHLLIS